MNIGMRREEARRGGAGGSTSMMTRGSFSGSGPRPYGFARSCRSTVVVGEAEFLRDAAPSTRAYIRSSRATLREA